MLFPSPGDLPDPVIEPTSFTLADGFFTTESPGKPRFRNSKKNTSPLYSHYREQGRSVSVFVLELKAAGMGPGGSEYFSTERRAGDKQNPKTI